MAGIVPCEFETKVALYRRADVRGTCCVNTPAAVFVLMLNNPVGGLLKPLRISRSEKGVQQDVIRFESGVGFQFSAPITFLVLCGEKKLARGAHRDRNTST